jgi:hypothetical protein
MNPDHLAKEADRLKNDPIFLKALEDIRADALNALAAANADDKTMILRLQSKVTVVDEISTVLERFIMGAEKTVQDEASPFA